MAVLSAAAGTLHPMLTRDDLASLDGQTIRMSEIRDGTLRLRLESGFTIGISVAEDGTLSVSDETAIP